MKIPAIRFLLNVYLFAFVVDGKQRVFIAVFNLRRHERSDPYGGLDLIGHVNFM